VESHETRTLDQSPESGGKRTQDFFNSSIDFGRVSTQLFVFPFSDDRSPLRTRTWPAIVRLESAGYRG